MTVLDRAGGELNHHHPTRLADRGILFTSEWADSSLIMAYSFETGETTRIAQGSRAAHVPEGYLLIRTQSGLLQVSPFDLESLSLTEAPVPYLDGVGEIAVASNGTLVYRPGSEARRTVVLVDWNGVETPLLADTADFARGASLSPDGARVLVTRVQTQGLETYQRSHVWVYERGGEGRPITTGENERHPVWSPDGEQVAYNTQEGERSTFRKRSDGVGERARVVDRAGVAGDLMQWTNDGLLVFDSEPTRVVPADGSSELRPLSTACEPFCRAGHISHDGRFWVYRAGPDNQLPPYPEIFVAELDNWMATRQQVSVGGAFYSGRWLPGDTAIVYLNMEQEMVLAAVDTVGGGLRIGERSTLFDANARNYHGAWDPRPDPQGRGLVLVKSVGAAPGQTVVVLNFLEEVKALLKP